jgi:hypothetical protein
MSNITYDYFRGYEASQYSFLKIPKLLFSDDFFKKTLSCEAKMLYGLMLDRMSLSVKNHWFDEENRAFIIFSIDDTMEMLNCSNKKAVKTIGELTKIGLIEKRRLGRGKPNIIYVKNFKLENYKLPKSEYVMPDSEVQEPEKQSQEPKLETTVEDKKPEENRNKDVDIVIKKWNSLEPLGLQKVIKVSARSKRDIGLQARLAEHGLDNVIKAIDNIKTSKFLQGKTKNNKGWKISFDWLICYDGNFVKVLEGRYTDCEQQKESETKSSLKDKVDRIYEYEMGCLDTDDSEFSYEFF